MKLTINIDPKLRNRCFEYALLHGLGPNKQGNYSTGDAVVMVLQQFFNDRKHYEQNS